MPAHIDERAIRSEDSGALTLVLAHAKAHALLPQIRDLVLLITSDQVVVWQGKIHEKSAHPQESRAFLRGYAEGPAETVTAAVVTHKARGVRQQGIDRATVWFRRIPEAVIDQVIARGEVFAQAGGFSITDPLLKASIERVGDTAESVIGLPTALTRQLLCAAMAAPAHEDPAAAGRGKPLTGGTSGP
jgi:predicted house-cleaning NTP pyrophosphatase (Maf/HAM1 superfamily)